MNSSHDARQSHAGFPTSEAFGEGSTVRTHAAIRRLVRRCMSFEPFFSPHTVTDRSPEQREFFERVYAVVAQIPPGRVATYGDIAAHVGRRGRPGALDWPLNGAAGRDLPCHRVVNRNGVLTGKRHFETPRVMKERLRSEGVTFVAEDRVDLTEHRWTPGDSEV